MTLTLEMKGESARSIEIDDSASIGRAPDCTVCLDDAQRGISRVQARIERRGDSYVLIDAGSNPTLLNEEALDASREAVLSDGDRIGIGAYVLVVSMEREEQVIDHTLMTQPASRTQAPVKDLPATPELEAPPSASLIPDDWNAPHKPVAERDEAPFTPDPLAATPLLREPGHFGGEADQALMEALSAGDPLRGASSRGSRSLEHVSPERVVSVMPRATMVEEQASATQDSSQQAIRGGNRKDSHDEEASASQRSNAAIAHDATRPDDPTLNALLKGLNISHADVAHLSAHDLAHLIGSLLREATQGAMSVLRSRAMTKRESRMAMTMIEERDNNPLKFFPDANRALTQMLGAQTRGYLAPEEAIRAAFRDIQAHELALIAGMRAAFDDAMSRIDPAVIERSMDAPNRFDAIVGNHKARLWQRFVKTWEHVSRDAGDDFQQRFGEPFSRAYQAQLDALQSSKD